MEFKNNYYDSRLGEIDLFESKKNPGDYVCIKHCYVKDQEEMQELIKEI